MNKSLNYLFTIDKNNNDDVVPGKGRIEADSIVAEIPEEVYGGRGFPEGAEARVEESTLLRVGEEVVGSGRAEFFVKRATELLRGGFEGRG